MIVFLTKERNEESNMGKVESLLSMMRTSRKPISTGFKKLDVSLDGGLYAPGLYIIAGGTSVGKTALMQQIAYNLAANKQDIIYFSLEMSIQDLFYRDLSRLSYLNGMGQSVHEIIQTQGALEYTGDIVIGLQFQATAKISENSKNVVERSKKLAEERNKPIRKMEAVILKHRNEKIGSKTFFDYIPKYNIYKEGLPERNNLDSLQLSLLQDTISKQDESMDPPVITKRTLN